MPCRAAVRSRRAVSAIFFANGMIMASWVPHVPSVKQRLGLSDGELGAVLLIGTPIAGIVRSFEVVR